MIIEVVLLKRENHLSENIPWLIVRGVAGLIEGSIEI